MLEKAPDLPTSAVDERFRFFEVTNVMLRYLGNGVNIRTEIPTDTNQLRLRRDFGKNGAHQFVKTFNRIVVAGAKVKRRPQERADYLLRYRRDFPLAVVEAKAIYANPGDGFPAHEDDGAGGRSDPRLCNRPGVEGV